MSRLKEISGELLAIAYLPKEKRNDALNNLEVIIESYQEDDIPSEQKQLILEILNDIRKESGIAPKSTATKEKSIASSKRVSKKQTSEIEVVEPETIKREIESSEAKVDVSKEETKTAEKEIEPIKIETEPIKKETELSIEDVDDAF